MKYRITHALTIQMACILMLAWLTPVPASAALVFYYNPDTGNVSLDTSETRNGSSFSYGLYLRHDLGFTFLHENQIRLSNSSQFEARPYALSDQSISPPLQGLLTIGNVLPTGLSEEVWSELFPVYGGSSLIGGSHTYADVLGGGTPPPAEFRYGAPSGEFDNRWDFVDPDSLTWASSATLVYQAWSGNVVIDTTGADSGYISSFMLRSADRFRADQFTPPLDSPLISHTSQQIGQIADAIEPGIYSLGEILEAGLSLQEFEAVFTEARFLERAGFNGGSFDFAADGLNFSLVYEPVPEPLAAIPLGLALLLARRRVTEPAAA